MLSILIPIYNFDVRNFVQDLSTLAERCSQPVEIICLDDGSEKRFKEVNAPIENINRVRYIDSGQNLGRSGVRNQLMQQARFDLLLFLDCDGRVVKEDYLEHYLTHSEADVIYGGRCYADDPPNSTEEYFHWFCGKHKEEVSVTERREQPFKSFMTNNFLIQRRVYEAVKMDEEIEGYGHEDTLFAAHLRKAGFQVTHINNPIEHLGLESVEVFLDKSRNAIENLALLIKRKEVGSELPLVRYYFLLKKLGLSYLFSSLILSREHMIIDRLAGKRPSLFLFDLWKLALLSKVMNKSK